MPDTIKLIQDRKDLPKSFSLENYADAGTMDAAGWAHLLSVRQYLRFISSVIEPDDPLFNELFRNPLNPQVDELWEKSDPANYRRSPVRSLTVCDLHFLSHDIGSDREYENEAKEVESSFDMLWTNHVRIPLSDSGSAFLSMAVDDIYSTIRGNEFIHLSVDISLSDEQLTESFSSALSNARKERGFAPGKKNYTKAKFKNWHRWGVLPFLDLSVWAKANNVRITQYVMGEAILPKNYEGDPTQAIRQTVKPMARKLMLPETISTLAGQAAREKG